MTANVAYPECPVQYVARVSYGMGQPPPLSEDGVPILRATNIARGKITTKHLQRAALSDLPLDRAPLLESGEILVVRSGAYTGDSAIVTDKWAGSAPGYDLRLTPDPSRVDPRFLSWCLLSDYSQDQFELKKLRAAQAHLNADELAQSRVPMPSLEVQLRVADMLDAETARIDTLIAKNQAASGLMSRRATETIARVVTEGATSGQLCATTLEWAPAIREEWKVAPYQYVARIGTGHTPSRAEDAYWQDCDIPWVTTTDVKHLRPGRIEVLKETEVKISDLGLRNSAATMHPAGTVFLSRTASVGFSGIMGVDMATSQDFFTWTCGPGLLPEYLLYVLRGMKSRGHFDRMMYGSTHKTIYYDELAQLRGPLPPLDEQRQAVERIRQTLAPLHSAMDRMDDMTRLLRTRRQALITAAVTGQITV